MLPHQIISERLFVMDTCMAGAGGKKFLPSHRGFFLSHSAAHFRAAAILKVRGRKTVEFFQK